MDNLSGIAGKTNITLNPIGKELEKKVDTSPYFPEPQSVVKVKDISFMLSQPVTNELDISFMLSDSESCEFSENLSNESLFKAKDEPTNTNRRFMRATKRTFSSPGHNILKETIFTKNIKPEISTEAYTIDFESLKINDLIGYSNPVNNMISLDIGSNIYSDPVLIHAEPDICFAFDGMNLSSPELSMPLERLSTEDMSKKKEEGEEKSISSSEKLMIEMTKIPSFKTPTSGFKIHKSTSKAINIGNKFFF